MTNWKKRAKQFFKVNAWLLILVLFTVLSETLHLFFENVPFNNNVSLDAPIYYFINQLGGSSLVFAIYVYAKLDVKLISQRLLAAGLIFWNLKEMKDEACYILKINDNVLTLEGWYFTQISLIIAIILFSGYGFIKWKS